MQKTTSIINQCSVKQKLNETSTFQMPYQTRSSNSQAIHNIKKLFQDFFSAKNDAKTQETSKIMGSAICRQQEKKNNQNKLLVLILPSEQGILTRIQALLNIKLQIQLINNTIQLCLPIQTYKNCCQKQQKFCQSTPSAKNKLNKMYVQQQNIYYQNKQQTKTLNSQIPQIFNSNQQILSKSSQKNYEQLIIKKNQSSQHYHQNQNDFYYDSVIDESIQHSINMNEKQQEEINFLDAAFVEIPQQLDQQIDTRQNNLEITENIHFGFFSNKKESNKILPAQSNNRQQRQTNEEQNNKENISNNIQQNIYQKQRNKFGKNNKRQYYKEKENILDDIWLNIRDESDTYKQKIKQTQEWYKFLKKLSYGQTEITYLAQHFEWSLKFIQGNNIQVGPAKYNCTVEVVVSSNNLLKKFNGTCKNTISKKLARHYSSIICLANIYSSISGLYENYKQVKKQNPALQQILKSDNSAILQQWLKQNNLKDIQQLNLDQQDKKLDYRPTLYHYISNLKSCKQQLYYFIAQNNKIFMPPKWITTKKQNLLGLWNVQCRIKYEISQRIYEYKFSNPGHSKKQAEELTSEKMLRQIYTDFPTLFNKFKKIKNTRGFV